MRPGSLRRLECRLGCRCPEGIWPRTQLSRWLAPEMGKERQHIWPGSTHRRNRLSQVSASVPPSLPMVTHKIASISLAGSAKRSQRSRQSRCVCRWW
jgi:hypothetical protein